MRLLLLLLLTACAPLTEQEQLERDTRIAEKRELWAYYQRACKERGVWVCHGPSPRYNEEMPWVFCGCNPSGDIFK